jgi:hypothetical protein
MDKAQHTPEPWTTNRTDDESAGLSIGTAKGAICLLVVDGGFTASEQTANAKLMTAAPTMLSALRDCLDRLETLADAQEATPRDLEVTKQVRDAIAAAS